MKNTTKKILSMLLAVIMLLSVMPVAYAAEKTVRDIFIEEYARYFSYYYEGCYYVQGRPRVPNRLMIDIDEALTAIAINDEEKMLHYLGTSKEANAIVEEQIASGEVVIGIDGYYLVLVFIKLYYKYNDDHLIMDFQERNPELTEEAWANYDKACDILQNGGTQVEFDAYAYKWVDLYSLLIEHLDGNHDFNDYISNGDATCEADGTKTATCEFCGATDTVADAGSKLKNHTYIVLNKVAPTCETSGYTVYLCECGDTYNGDQTPATGHNFSGDKCTDCGKVKDNNCSCNCHKSGFMGFIWKIINFFQKLFKTNPTCACGVAHY